MEGVRALSLLHSAHTGSGAYPMSKGALSSGLKRPEHLADHLPPTSAEVRKTWLCVSTVT
jgi:hypothetical protein